MTEVKKEKSNSSNKNRQPNPSTNNTESETTVPNESPSANAQKPSSSDGLSNENNDGDSVDIATTAIAKSKSKSQPSSKIVRSSPPPSSSVTIQTKGSKKRRKVNHACLYCRRSHMTCDDERPCTRCVKRDIGHLCHDEPREPHKKSKAEANSSGAVSAGSGTKDHLTNGTSPTDNSESISPPTSGVIATPQMASVSESVATSSSYVPVTSMPPPKTISGASNTTISPGSTAQTPNIGSNSTGLLDIPDWTNQQRDWNPYHHQYMFSNPEVSTEYNLMNEFLFNSIYDDALLASDNLFPDSYLSYTPRGGYIEQEKNAAKPAIQQTSCASIGTSPKASRKSNAKPSLEKAKELYYLTAADPPKDGIPEERMKQVLKAKHDAGLLKPFNYINGYKRLQNYMEKNLSASSKQRIQKSIQEFRPKFRERTQTLTDIDLVFVEEWFERSLMEYDRVFASMAVPACLWRRTGEIFRGNKEFAELIHVPIEKMRDGKLAIYELIAEESAVSYWEKFGAIAFDTGQKAMLTTCYLHNPDQSAKEALIHCCFSFTIRRDSYNIPSMIIGNFLPIPP